MRRVLFLILGIVFGLSAPAQAKLLAAVSIAPQAYFLKQIAGDRVDVLVMVPAGSDPHTYEPKPRQLAQLAKAALYFGVGMDVTGVEVRIDGVCARCAAAATEAPAVDARHTKP